MTIALAVIMLGVWGLLIVATPNYRRRSRWVHASDGTSIDGEETSSGADVGDAGGGSSDGGYSDGGSCGDGGGGGCD